MRSFAPLVLLLVPAAALAVLIIGPLGAGMSALGGLLLAVGAALLVRSDEHRRKGGGVDRASVERHFLAHVVLAAFALRAALAFGLRATDLNMVLGGDEGTFHVNAQVFQLWLEGELPLPFQAKWADSSQVGYFVFVGLIYYVIGPVQIIPVLINCVIGAACAVPAYRLAAPIGGRTAGRVAAVVVAFFPSLVLWSALLVRDAPVFFLILWTTVLARDLLIRLSLLRLSALIGCMALLGTLRTYMFVLLAVAFSLSLAVSFVRRPGRAFLLLAVGAIGGFLLVGQAGLGADFIDEMSLARLDEQRRLNALGGSAGIDFGGHDLSTPMGALIYLPIGLVHFLLTPFPWEMGGRQILAAPDVLLWYCALPFVPIGAVWALRRRRRWVVLPIVAASAIAVLYALGEGNVGIIVRHRAQLLVLALPIAAVGVVRVRVALKRRRAALAKRTQAMLGPRTRVAR